MFLRSVQPLRMMCFHDLLNMLCLVLYCWCMAVLVTKGQKLRIDGKIADYGQSLILYCEIENCCSKSVGWEIWDPDMRILFIDVRGISHTAEAKYYAEPRINGYSFIIRNFSREDLNIGHSCSYQFKQGAKIILLENDLLIDESPTDSTYIDDTETTTKAVGVDKNNNCNNRTSVGVVVIITEVITFVLAAAIIALVFKAFKIRITSKRTSFRKSRSFNRLPGRLEEIPLIGDGTDDESLENQECHTCRELAICAICADCSHEYCEICCEAHTKYYPEHTVCQIQHVFTSKYAVQCKFCQNAKAVNVCMTCKKIFCIDCNKKHKHEDDKGKIKRLLPQFTRSRSLVDSEPHTKDTKYSYSIQVTQHNLKHCMRVCGIAFLSDCRIVLADSNNKRLVVFHESNPQFEANLEGEPRSLTSMTDNNIAMTFSVQREIWIFAVLGENVEKKATISLDAKPFSISYNKGHFAVEVGVGDDGKILIISEDGELKCAISNATEYAYFTGNTIRLALTMGEENKNGKVFVAALSKKSIFCIDFEGHVLWTKTIPSPRSIVVVPGKDWSEKNVLCANRRCNVIARFREKDGHEDILFSGKEIISPRYLAFHREKNLLCIQVKKNDCSADDLEHTTGRACFIEELRVYTYKPLQQMQIK